MRFNHTPSVRSPSWSATSAGECVDKRRRRRTVEKPWRSPAAEGLSELSPDSACRRRNAG
jgi:hypothetical protein